MLIQIDQLVGPVTDVHGEVACSRLPRGSLCRRSAGAAIGNREVFAHVEARRSGVLDCIPHS
ncbi:hypothetical protein BST12_11980 [Mycobacterium angelicum]|uniref:Uncharacterized protein n=2 Tax=Mycobacterium angelicum TaxID=470074 RepID=A0A1W9ZUR3_MYCAN|nr:hypothetical protein BST12_11980 [Mycobacterium angelicum]